MNYDLAKQLKDAGFPQHDKLDGGPPEHEHNCFTDGLCKPTLSELIDALEGDFYSLLLKPTNRLWYATGIASWRKNQANGKTPEEAVAKLWLKLKD